MYWRIWHKCAGSQPVMLLENSCCHVCQGAILLPHFLPAFTALRWIHVYDVVAMVIGQNSKRTGRS